MFGAILVGAVMALADSVKQLFYSVRVVTGTNDEAQTYYAVTGAPATFNEWMKKYNVPARQPGESLDAYRRRAQIAVFYNENELGLGRELGCSTFQDIGPTGVSQPGLACFVTNYGERFKDGDKALADAVAGTHAKDTFTHVYAPSSTPVPLGGTVPLYAVQFWSYSAENGRRQDWAALDNLGHRPIPMICSNCHGGTYDSIDHLVIGGQFTPINTSILTFSGAPGYTLADQEARIAHLNTLMATIPYCKTSGQARINPVLRSPSRGFPEARSGSGP